MSSIDHNPSSKVRTLTDAIATFVKDGDMIAIEGFTHLISFAAAHEIIRQRRRDLILVRMAPDIVYEQMIVAGCARKLIFSWIGNPGVGSLHTVRRLIEQERLEIEEYTHFGMMGRYVAGASHLPFYPLNSFVGSDLPNVNTNIRYVRSPFADGQEIPVVPPINPDVAIIHAHRADAAGNVQSWGILGVQREASLASRRVIAVVEELVDSDVIRSDPNRTILHGSVVDAVCVEPLGAHPSYVQGTYDRDTNFYRGWDEISGDPVRLSAWLDKWVFGVGSRHEYVELLGSDYVGRLRPLSGMSRPVDFGRHDEAAAQ